MYFKPRTSAVRMKLLMPVFEILFTEYGKNINQSLSLILTTINEEIIYFYRSHDDFPLRGSTGLQVKEMG